MKQCARCKQEKPLSDFYRDVRFDDGRPRGACKSCMSRARPKRIVTPATKECSKCGQTKPAADFLGELRHADGLRSECADCFYSHTRYLKGQEWRHANTDRIRAYNAKWQAYRLRWLKRWRKEHPEKAAALDAVLRYRRRARKAAVENTLTAHQWREIKAIYGGRCVYCGNRSDRLTMDHVVPLVRGGSHTAENVVPACRSCNFKKHDKPAPDHQPILIRP